MTIQEQIRRQVACLRRSVLSDWECDAQEIADTLEKLNAVYEAASKTRDSWWNGNVDSDLDGNFAELNTALDALEE